MFNAQETLKQLGGNRFVALTGAKNLARGADHISMRIGRNAKAVNYVKITLNSMDTYDMEFGRVHGMKYKVKAEAKGIYCDMLAKTFEEHTGLYTSL